MVIFIVLLVFSMFIACGSPNVESTDNTLPNKGSVSNNVDMFIKQENGYVGDPIPYFDGEKMNIYYLHDSRRAGPFHPWYLFQTSDFLSYQDKGEVISTAKSSSEIATNPDYALGTGSVIQDKNGLYHAFYTGWNNHDDFEYTEKIQHATSSDLVNWTKIPQDGFYGGLDDFRDPYVYYDVDNDRYSMLITTKFNNKGIIAEYVSNDLVSWSNNGIFFSNDAGTYNLECPTYMFWNGYYYLTYSEQASDGSSTRVMRYRYKKNVTDAWIKPEIDYIDGAGFYAGKIEKFKDDRLLSFGWVGTKVNEMDSEKFDWGGNLVVHEINQNLDGSLYASVPLEIANEISTQVKYDVANGVSLDSKSNITLSSSKNIYFQQLETKVTKMSFSTTNNDTKLQLIYGVNGTQTNKSQTIDFDFSNKTAKFYIIGDKAESDLQISIKFKKMPEYKIEVYTQNDCLSVYINGTTALTTRIYGMTKKNFGFIANGTSIDLHNIQFFE